jgi:2-dehydropantoate 2-reductase
VQTVAAAEGITITQDDIEGMIKHNISLPPRGRSSMCDDVLAGRPTENRWFCGTLSKKAKEHGIRTPYSDLLYMLLEAKSGR